jgi:hypothetical protein
LFPRLAAFRLIFLRLVTGNGIMGDGENFGVQQTVAREVEGIDLDRRVLPDFDEADVTVGDHRRKLL